MTAPHPLMKPSEVAATFRVGMQTVTRWRKTGKLTVVPTPGIRTMRFYRAQVEAIMRGEELTPDQIAALHRSIFGGAR